MRLSSFCDSAFLQYPQTGRTSGNTNCVAKADVLVDLAVPSDGSNLRQLSNSGDPYKLEPVLQYPQTGRTSGNSRRSTSMTLSYVLAVPSDGSNLRQLTTTSWYHIACTSCSTLRRVEPQATSCYSPTIRLLSVLQYPQTGRT